MSIVRTNYILYIFYILFVLYFCSTLFIPFYYHWGACLYFDYSTGIFFILLPPWTTSNVGFAVY